MDVGSAALLGKTPFPTILYVDEDTTTLSTSYATILSVAAGKGVLNSIYLWYSVSGSTATIKITLDTVNESTITITNLNHMSVVADADSSGDPNRWLAMIPVNLNFYETLKVEIKATSGTPEIQSKIFYTAQS